MELAEWDQTFLIDADYRYSMLRWTRSRRILPVSILKKETQTRCIRTVFFLFTNVRDTGRHMIRSCCLSCSNGLPASAAPYHLCTAACFNWALVEAASGVQLQATASPTSCAFRRKRKHSADECLVKIAVVRLRQRQRRGGGVRYHINRITYHHRYDSN